MQKILIVEDDDVIASLIKTHLEKWDYQVCLINDFTKVLEEFVQYDPSLVLLDISLPFYNGYHWCQQIREISQVPIIFISSMNENMNIVMAMNMGADDFITKPFDLNVLTAKIQAIYRRTYSFAKQMHILQYKELVLNIIDTTLTYQKNSIDLTKNELKILEKLFMNPEEYVARDDIMTYLWQSSAFVDDNTLSVNMNRLRKKIEDLGINSCIQTKKGLGYRLYYD